jgi:hypothetical protein
MTGAALMAEERSLCEEYELHLLPKPFLQEDVFSLVRKHFKIDRRAHP